MVESLERSRSSEFDKIVASLEFGSSRTGVASVDVVEKARRKRNQEKCMTRRKKNVRMHCAHLQRNSDYMSGTFRILKFSLCTIAVQR